MSGEKRERGRNVTRQHVLRKKGLMLLGREKSHDINAPISYRRGRGKFS